MNKLPKFIMLCGLPGSGKSTYCNRFKDEKDYIIVSSDSIREELGNINNQSKNQEVFKIAHSRIKEALKNGYNVIQDSTSLSRKRRIAFLNELKNIPCEKICVLFATPYELALARNFARDRQVPEDVLVRMYKQFETPCIQEGFDDIQIVWADYKDLPGFEFDIYSDIQKWRKIEHNNPHHEYTIGDHMIAAYNYYMKNYKEYDMLNRHLSCAVVMHDCGKPDVKAFVNHKGESCDIAHFYSHENIGSYKSLFYFREFDDCSDNDVLYVSLLIGLHMRPYLSWDQSEKAKEKDRKLFGDDIIRDIEILHECDLAAH